ncbi:MAG: MerR family transcriptional regulator [Actinomycetota bacterium]|nr:MerR family transcriptional regulator [Actinomycetota bacterium]
MAERHMQIGEVAERTSLSLRTIRYYEEVGLVPPSARTPGGFRLYTEADVERLMVVKRMKPLEFSLDEMRDLLEILDALVDADVREPTRRQSLDRLSMYREVAQSRIENLRTQLEAAEGFAAELNRRQERHPARSGRRP